MTENIRSTDTMRNRPTRRRRKMMDRSRLSRDNTAGSWRHSLSAFSLLLALSYDRHVSAFAPNMSVTLEASVHSHSTSRATSISFRNVDHDDTHSAGVNANTNTNTNTNTNSSSTNNENISTSLNSASHLESLLSRSIPSTPTITTHFNHDGRYADRMPSWLKPRGDLFDEKLDILRKSMKESSYLSHLDAGRVIAAIREASSGHEDLMAGAAEFALLLIETMDMVAGVETLIAAVFHYCECYSARLHEAKNVNFPPSYHEYTTSSSESEFSHLNYWDCYKSYAENIIDHQIHQTSNYLNSRCIKIGPDAHQLVQDAARIKRAEMVASQSANLRPSTEEAGGMRKMLLSETRDWRALALRSAACLYRLRGINEHYADLLTKEKETKNIGMNMHDVGNKIIISPKDIRVAREALSIHAPLASRLGMHRLKNEIEGAAFSILYPRQHAEVTKMTQDNKPCKNLGGDECIVSTLSDGMTLILHQVTQKVERLLETDHYFSQYVDSDSVKVTARIKEPYSLWRKMLKLGAKNVLDVPDALALRVVFDAKKLTVDEAEDVTSARERALCYYVQQSCIDLFKPVKEGDGRFKDYIARPKPNGYQSLHYTAFTTFDSEEWPFEIQVRTGDMHQVAEYGLAAHWDYKAQEAEENINGSGSPHYAFKLDNSSDAYLRSVQEWHWEQAQARASWVAKSENSASANEKLAPYLEKLMKDQSNLKREHVFVFLSCNNNNNNNSSSAGSSNTCCTSSQILELPAGACVLDAIHESERMLGYDSRYLQDDQIIHNGHSTTLTQQLSNGDIVTIPAVTTGTPTPTVSM